MKASLSIQSQKCLNGKAWMIFSVEKDECLLGEKLRRPFRILGSEQKLEDPRHQWQAVQCKANIYHCNSTLFCTALYRDSMTRTAHGMLNSTLTCNITAFRSSALFCIQLYIYSTVHIAIAVCRHALQVTVTVRCQSLQRFLNALIE